MKRKMARKNNWLRIVCAILAIVMLGGIIGATVNHFNKDTRTISVSAFSIGGLTEDGKYLESKNRIYTKDAFECAGLHIVPEFELNVSYVVYFYDEDGAFIEKTELMTEEFKDSVPAAAKTARVVIIPNDEDIELNVFQIRKYAKQLTISVANQDDTNKTPDTSEN